MPRHWRTVYKSSHKKVLVKPRPHRGHHHTANLHINTSSGQNDMDISWIWPVAQMIIAVIVIVFCVDLLITAWPYLLIAAIIGVIIAG